MALTANSLIAHLLILLFALKLAIASHEREARKDMQLLKGETASLMQSIMCHESKKLMRHGLAKRIVRYARARIGRSHIILLLILLSGDVELNPGPTSLKCQDCNKNEGQLSQGDLILCSNCSSIRFPPKDRPITTKARPNKTQRKRTEITDIDSVKTIYRIKENEKLNNSSSTSTEATTASYVLETTNDLIAWILALNNVIYVKMGGDQKFLVQWVNATNNKEKIEEIKIRISENNSPASECEYVTIKLILDSGEYFVNGPKQEEFLDIWQEKIKCNFNDIINNHASQKQTRKPSGINTEERKNENEKRQTEIAHKEDINVDLNSDNQTKYEAHSDKLPNLWKEIQDIKRQLKNIKPACIQDLLVEERKRSDGLTRENEKLKGRISQLEKELKKITQSQPSRSNQYHHPVKCDHADATMHQQPYYHPHTTTATTNAPTPIGTAILPHNTPTQLLQQPMLPPRSNQYHHPVNFDQVDASKHQQPYYHPHTTTATTNATTRIGTTILPHNTPTQLLQQPMLLPRTNQYHDPVKFDQADEHQQPYYHPHTTTATTNAPTPIRTQPGKEQAFIIGDSMVKDLEGHKMSRRKKITVHSTSGADSAAFKHYIKPVITKKPKQIVIHCGTNDLENPNIDTVTNIKDIIEEIARSTPETIIAISSIISRYDKPLLNRKIKELNKEIQQMCTNLGAAFINNDNIGFQSLNGSRLHLNKSGNIAFARNMISFLQAH